MKRIIVDYKKLNTEILNLLVEKFPDGYDDNDIISFRDSKGQQINAVEIRTDDINYLVKIDMKLQQAIKDYSDDDFNDNSLIENLSFDLD
ncbi:MAG: hypothetical protein ACPGC8_08185 [Flavobacteriaceae bacterium]